MTEKPYCCGMRRRFVVAIIGEDKRHPVPPEILDYTSMGEAGPCIKARFCLFCGQPLKGQPVREIKVTRG